MFAKFALKYGRKLVMWAVIAASSALARKAVEKWASKDDPIETTGAAHA
ncbi:MAG: hypothetical protein ACTHN0_03435 [Aquihabitans sp.]